MNLDEVEIEEECPHLSLFLGDPLTGTGRLP